MSTHVATSNPVRSDVFTTEDQPSAPAGRGIYAKLHANGRAEAIVKAREAGFGKS